MSRFASELRSRATSLLASVVITAALTDCDLGTINVPRTAPTLVVHGVLNPSATTQVVLVERTLTGTVNIPDTSFDAVDPIVSAGGVPVTGALVDIIDATGKVVHSVEDRAVPANNGKGSGVYRFPIAGNALVLGARYQLHVHTTTGEDLTAFTRVPTATVRIAGGLTRNFNRDHDVLSTQWTRATGARTYLVRIESPFGPFFFFTDSVSIHLTGDLRNPFSTDLERLFIPGFRQDMVVAAVDSNFYDYYRTNNDPFTGSGIISRVIGGLGLFGSLVALNTGTITVAADIGDPIEGRFRLTPTSNDPNTPTLLTLYIESPSTRADVPTALSGRYMLGSSVTRGDGIIGELSGTDVTLAILANQLAADTVDVFVGELEGDTLRGSYRRARTAAVFGRVP